MVLACRAQVRRIGPAAPVPGVDALPGDVAIHVHNVGLLHPHGEAEPLFARAAQQLGARNHLREILRPVIVVLQHPDRSFQGCPGDEDAADPVVDHGAGDFMRVGAVAHNRDDLRAMR